jgi:hypothetical protein
MAASAGWRFTATRSHPSQTCGALASTVHEPGSEAVDALSVLDWAQTPPERLSRLLLHPPRSPLHLPVPAHPADYDPEGFRGWGLVCAGRAGCSPGASFSSHLRLSYCGPRILRALLAFVIPRGDVGATFWMRSPEHSFALQISIWQDFPPPRSCWIPRHEKVSFRVLAESDDFVMNAEKTTFESNLSSIIHHHHCLKSIDVMYF